MNIRICGVKDCVSFNHNDIVKSGGEGSIFRLPPNMLVKLYHEDQIIPMRQEKVLELCSKYETFKGLFSQNYYAFPQVPANRMDNDEIVGFSMANLGLEYPHLDEIGFDEDSFKIMNNGKQLTDDIALELIYDLFMALHKLHTALFVLGDLNPSNICYNYDTQKPFFFDFDSAQFGKYGCPVYTESYLDPYVIEAGKTVDGCYKYSTKSDCFAMAVIAYELFVGYNPYAFRSNPPMREVERSAKQLALIGHMFDPNYLQRVGNSALLDHPQNTACLERLSVLKNKDKRLFQYFFDTFVIGKRENLLFKLPKTDKRNPSYVFHAREKVRTIVDILKEGRNNDAHTDDELRDKTSIFDEDDLKNCFGSLREHKNHIRQNINTKDPDMFRRFVENMGIDYSQIILQGI